MTQPYGYDSYGQQPPSQPYPPQQPGYGYPPGPPPPPRKKSSAPLVLGIIGVVVLVLFGGCAVIVTALGSVGNSPSTSATVADTPEEEPADEPAKKKTEEPKAEEPKVAGIGAVVKDGDFTFKVTKLEKRARVGNDFLGEDAQGVFLLVHVTVKNVGDEAGSFFGASQKLYDAKGREYEASSGASIYLKDSKSLYEKINPGNAVNGVVLFDIPKNVKPTEIELHDSMFSEGVKVNLS
jgi:hypothetical protein